MTEDDKKKLTKWMGECWHEEDIEYTKKAIRDPRHRSVFAICSKCKKTYGRSKRDRTFTTDADMMAVFRKLAEKCEWEKFYQWAMPKYAEIEKIYTGVMQQRFVAWLLHDPERFCSLVAEFKPWEK